MAIKKVSGHMVCRSPGDVVTDRVTLLSNWGIAANLMNGEILQRFDEIMVIVNATQSTEVPRLMINCIHKVPDVQMEKELTSFIHQGYSYQKRKARLGEVTYYYVMF